MVPDYSHQAAFVKPGPVHTSDKYAQGNSLGLFDGGNPFCFVLEPEKKQ
jgi:hypothetical protein